MREIKLVEVKSEIGAGTRGASLGIDALKIAALDFGSDYFRRFESVIIPDENTTLLEPSKTPFARRIKGVLTMWERTSGAIKDILQKGDFPIVLSGDHSNSGGTISGIKMAYPDKRLGVIWIDAHADLHSPYTTPSGNVHGMPLAAVLGEDNLRYKINNIDDNTADLWKQLKNLGGVSPKFSYDNLVYVCLRDVEPEENFLITTNRVRVVTVDDIVTYGIEKTSREILSAVEPCDIIYISFDVDCMDSAISRGTGTPVPSGISEKQAANLLLRLIQDEKVCCFEITEINPTLDSENLMAENAFEILQRVTNHLIDRFEDEEW